MTATIATPPVTLPAGLSELRPEQLDELRATRSVQKKIRRAVGYALFDAWGVAIFAGLTTLGGLFDVSGLLLGAGMAVVAAVEFRFAARLKRLDPEAPRVLALNQLGFAGLLILYALWRIYVTLTGPGAFADAIAQGDEVAKIVEPYAHLARQLSLLVYGTLIVGSLAMQGGTAVYYFTRAKHVRAALRDTPAWIVALQKAGVSV